MLDIILENKNFLIINKPSGLIVHPTTFKEKNTLVDFLIEYDPDIKNVGDDKELRPGIVHRLDKDVSGLMVIAKTQKAFDYLKEQFKERKVKKEYYALVYGDIKEEKGIIDLALGFSKRKSKIKMTVFSQNKSKTAITEYEVLKRFLNFTFLKVRIKTGRTHQIRAHLNFIGHPILGDKIYRNKGLERKMKKKIKLDRIFLHSFKLGFFDLENKWVEFEKDLPEELKKTMSIINL
ncbi:RNA pseudouridine synthase [Candidatus Kuenenbacteria bacterium HGW-Kuenenbacteria-1]|uniref:Pseudouridine synthase n=1 Tax=Candidatus Kuenenbacteria bacterium HGW-Kuenenbacteria-1 TaxID=2013812 RepID=A0A2N1UMZ8_9BACT|nr:MAG: RNA pseudouridine synthase [Candidatus Kuenenbacteria bacterium HGW-Kuenenbacteria-1]